MRKHIGLSVAFLVAARVTCAQTPVPTADDFFNRAAREYVKEDKLAALRTLDKGLQAHPGDARMLSLAEALLKEQQQQQQQQQQEQKQQEQEQGQGQAQEKEPFDSAQGGQAQKQEGREGEQRKPTEGIAKEDAERILDALQRQEKDTQEKVRAQMRPARRARIEKDW